MKLVTIIVAGIVGFLFAHGSQANHETIPVLQGKVYQPPEQCLIDNTGKFSEKGMLRLCFLFIRKEDIGKDFKEAWVAVLDTTVKRIIFVIEIKDGKDKVVWRYGQVGL